MIFLVSIPSMKFYYHKYSVYMMMYSDILEGHNELRFSDLFHLSRTSFYSLGHITAHIENVV